jgi:hypothetical protein
MNEKKWCPTRNDLRRDDERDPGDDNKEATWQVSLQQDWGSSPDQINLKKIHELVKFKTCQFQQNQIFRLKVIHTSNFSQGTAKQKKSWEPLILNSELLNTSKNILLCYLNTRHNI